jgi:hypothetical protein
MGLVSDPERVMPLVAAFSRYPAALDWARDRVVEHFGPICRESSPFDFEQTEYYTPSMGSGIKKVFFTCARLVDPGDLADTKLLSNAWEAEYAAGSDHPEARPLNLDPGYLTRGKLVLASTKDFAHRIYLARGIYAEVTLQYRHGCWEDHQWTFADYRRADYQRFFSACRDELRSLIREERLK